MFRVSCVVLQLSRKALIFLVRKMFTEIEFKKVSFKKICFPNTLIFKEHDQIVKIYMVKFDIRILDKPKTWRFYK